MIILTIRTDKPQAEIGLFENTEQLAYEEWQAHRQLAETIHSKIAALLQAADKDWDSIQGIVVYKGPGSFTGLRIGLSLANALSYGLKVPLVTETGEDWRANGVARLQAGQREPVGLPDYGSPAHVTAPKK